MGDQSVSSVNPLEQFVLLSKNAKGAAAVELIKQALEAPAVFVFGELLDMANIQVLQLLLVIGTVGTNKVTNHHCRI